MTPEALAERIDAILPQTQCTKCGFEGCRPYAQAIASGEAAINRCPPGGSAGIARLAELLRRAPLPLDPDCGDEGPLRVALIDASLCIGCTKCIVACPVDAIIGAPKRMHTVDEAACSGCDLCVPACPVDCITMRPPSWRDPAWTSVDADAARGRFERRRERLAEERAEHDLRLAKRGVAAVGPAPDAPSRPSEIASSHRPGATVGGVSGAGHGLDDNADDAARRRREVIEAAMRRARERLATLPPRDGKK